MPKMLCTCGNTLNFGDIPCKIQYKFISDVEFDKFHGEIDADDLYLKMKSFLICSSCNRLWFFWNGFGDPPIGYSPMKE